MGAEPPHPPLQIRAKRLSDRSVNLLFCQVEHLENKLLRYKDVLKKNRFTGTICLHDSNVKLDKSFSLPCIVFDITRLAF